MLWHSCSCKGTEFLIKIAQEESTSPFIKKRIKNLKIKTNIGMIPDKKYYESFERRKIVYQFVTDYTIIEVYDLIQKLRKYKCI